MSLIFQFQFSSFSFGGDFWSQCVPCSHLWLQTLSLLHKLSTASTCLSETIDQCCWGTWTNTKREHSEEREEEVEEEEEEEEEKEEEEEE